MKNLFATHPAMFEQMHDAVIATDLEGIVTHCNSAAERIYEYARHELIGSNVAILYPETELPRMQALIEVVRANGRADAELLNQTRSGREIWVHLSVSLLQAEGQQPYGMMGFSIDITEQKKAEQAQREIEEMYRGARAAAGVGTWYWDLRTNQLNWDEQSSKLLDVVEQPSYDVFMQRVHPDDRKRMEETFRRCIAAGTEYSAEYRVVWRDGSVRWLSGRGRTIYDDNDAPVRMLGVASDITDHKPAEEEREQAEERYRALFRSSYVGTVSASLDGILDANDAYCDLIGYSREELLSGSVRWQDITPDEYLKRDFDALHEMLSTGVCTPFEKEYIAKDGRRIRVLISATLLAREPLQYSCFVVDLSQQQRSFGALLAAGQLASAAKMASALAHEINNPLSSLTNLLYLLRSSRTGPQREDLLMAAQEALDRVTRITRQMIGLYSESDKIVEFRAGEVLEDTLAAYSARTRAKNIRVEKRNELGTVGFHGVESDLRRLFSGLIENAVEHLSPGGTMKVHLCSAREWKDTRRHGLRIVVYDNGPGITGDVLNHLYEPFFSTKEAKGRGLGLWATRGIVERHGGKVRVRTSTRPGISGTCFSVFLPEKREREAEGEPVVA